MDTAADTVDFASLVEELKAMGWSEAEASRMARDIIENEESGGY